MSSETFREWQDKIWDNCPCCKDIYGNGEAAWVHQQKKIDQQAERIRELEEKIIRLEDMYKKQTDELKAWKDSHRRLRADHNDLTAKFINLERLAQAVRPVVKALVIDDYGFNPAQSNKDGLVTLLRNADGRSRELMDSEIWKEVFRGEVE